jgi:hypothetical protein
LAHGNRDPGMDLPGIEARRYGGIGEVHRFWLLADEQYPRHAISLCRAILDDPRFSRKARSREHERPSARRLLRGRWRAPSNERSGGPLPGETKVWMATPNGWVAKTIVEWRRASPGATLPAHFNLSVEWPCHNLLCLSRRS